MSFTTNELIEAYVDDVALRLPRRQRNDVAFELRALLGEALRDRAADAGRAPDADMALALLREFGHPADVAARYRTPLTIIDPSDGRRFLHWSIGGLLVIWVLGLLSLDVRDGAGVGEWLSAIGSFWGGTFVRSMWWPGVLVVGFGLAAWSRRTQPRSATWSPRVRGALVGGRAGHALAIVGMVLGIVVLMEPSRVLDLFWGGRAAPAAYQALTYTEGFLGLQAPILFGLVALNVPLFALAIAKGRWAPWLERAGTVLALATCAAMAWVVFDGPVMMTTVSDRAFKGLLALILVVSVADLAIRWLRTVRPAPN